MLFHMSPFGNHLSLNALGAPFAQLFDIESAAKQSKKDKRHGPSDIYMDDCFFKSLNFLDSSVKPGYEKIPYKMKMHARWQFYRFANRQMLLAQLGIG